MGTHLNAYKADALEALEKAHAAVTEAEAKLDALFREVESKLEPTEAPVASEPPVVTVKTSK